jgi:hypothetical protein
LLIPTGRSSGLPLLMSSHPDLIGVVTFRFNKLSGFTATGIAPEFHRTSHFNDAGRQPIAGCKYRKEIDVTDSYEEISRSIKRNVREKEFTKILKSFHGRSMPLKKSILHLKK